MDNIKDDAYYADKVYADLGFIIRHMSGVDVQIFTENEILQDSMMFRLIQISENVRKLSDQFKEQNAAVPWTAISGLRNRIVHDYGNVNMTIIYDTLKDDVPALMDILREQLHKV